MVQALISTSLWYRFKSKALERKEEQIQRTADKFATSDFFSAYNYCFMLCLLSSSLHTAHI